MQFVTRNTLLVAQMLLGASKIALGAGNQPVPASEPAKVAAHTPSKGTCHQGSETGEVVKGVKDKAACAKKGATFVWIDSEAMQPAKTEEAPKK